MYNKISLDSRRHEFIKFNRYMTLKEYAEYIGSDVYNLYDNDEKIGIALIPNLKISHYCLKNITTKPVQCSCVYSNKFQKWIPLNVIQNSN